MLYNNYAIFGRSQTGKTTFLNEKFVAKFDKENVFAVDFKQQVNTENRLHSIELLVEKAKKRKNSLFVIDDGSGILQGGNSTVINDFLFLLNTARHDNNYYIFVYHSTDYFPLKFVAGIHCFIFFTISENAKQVVNKMPVFTPTELKEIEKERQIGEFIAVYKNK
jgi:hypothetical protein